MLEMWLVLISCFKCIKSCLVFFLIIMVNFLSKLILSLYNSVDIRNDIEMYI